MKHPLQQDLALLAGGESGALRRFFLNRHLRNCEDCQEKLAEFRDLRERLADAEMPEVNWDFLASEMRANIRVGLEAGACVRPTLVAGTWAPRLTVAFASLLLVVGASFFLTDSGLHAPKVIAGPTPVLQATHSGIELRKGTDSFTFLDQQGERTEQTVSAQGVLEARYVNGETGSVTINNVYLQQ